MRQARQPLTAGQLVWIILGFIFIPPLLCTSMCGVAALSCAAAGAGANKSAETGQAVEPSHSQP